MPLTYELKSDKSGRSYQVDFDKEPSSEEIDHTILEMDQKRDAEESDPLTAGLREGLKSYPSLAAGGAAASAAQPIIAPIAAATGPLAPVTEGALSFITALGGTIAARWAQDKTADALIPKDLPLFSQLRTEQSQEDVKLHPTATMMGSLFAGGSPNIVNLARTGKTVIGALSEEGQPVLKAAYTAIAKGDSGKRAFIAAAEDAADLKLRHAAIEGIEATMKVGIGSGMFGGQALIEGRPIQDVLTEAAIGAVFTGHSPIHVLTDAITTKKTTKVVDDGSVEDLAAQTNAGASDPSSAVSTLAKDPNASALDSAPSTDQLKAVPDPLAPNPVHQTVAAIEEEGNEAPATTAALLKKSTESEFSTDENESHQSTVSQEGDIQPKIVAATYTDENGNVHQAQDHITAAALAGVEAPNKRQDREDDSTYGFMLSDGRVIGREEAANIGSNQFKENITPESIEKFSRGQLHSDHIEMGEPQLSLKEGGFKSPQEFKKSYEKEGLHDMKETPEEFLNRMFCR